MSVPPNVSAYITQRIASYKLRANMEHRPEIAAEFRVSATTLAVLLTDLEAGLHLPDEVVQA